MTAREQQQVTDESGKFLGYGKELSGLRQVTDAGAQHEDRPSYWIDGIARLDPRGETPLMQLVSKLRRRRTVDSVEVNFFTEMWRVNRLRLTGNVASSASPTLGIGAGTGGNVVARSDITGDDGRADPSKIGLVYKKNDMFQIEQTGEIVILTEDSNGASLKVKKVGGGNVKSVTIGNVGVNPYLTYAGNAYPHGSRMPEAFAWNPVKRSQYIETFKHTFYATAHQLIEKYRTGDLWKHDMKNCYMQHKRAIEEAIFMGQMRFEFDDNARTPTYYMNGILPQLPTQNIINKTGADIVLPDPDQANAERTIGKAAGSDIGVTDMDYIEKLMHDMFLYGSQEKLAICGGKAIHALNQAVRKNGHLNIEPLERRSGLLVQQFQHASGGTLMLARHPIWSNLYGGYNAPAWAVGNHAKGAVVIYQNKSYTATKALTGSNTGNPAEEAAKTSGDWEESPFGGRFFSRESSMLVLDLEDIEYMTLKGRDTQLKTGLEENDRDGKKAGYLSDVSNLVHFPNKHFYVAGLEAGVKDAA